MGEVSNTPSVRYYEDELVTLYHGDGAAFDPVGQERFITDPPYGAGAYPSDVAPRWGTFARWIEGTATCAIFGYPEELASLCARVGAHPAEWVTWWPPNKPPVHFSKKLPREVECIAVFGEVCDSRGLTRPRSADKTNRAIASQRGLDPENARLGDVWTDFAPGFGFNHHQRQHPNEKPLSLMVKLVTLCSQSGDIVVDPFAGSGTTLVAAKQLGRRAIGFEIEESFCEIAAQRCSQDVLQFDTEDAEWAELIESGDSDIRNMRWSV